ncbi:hypothetical protein [Burkholderia phage BCSR5]|nr:hypothetical protein [Burkholderia phage BCSR5]
MAYADKATKASVRKFVAALGLTAPERSNAKGGVKSAECFLDDNATQAKRALLEAGFKRVGGAFYCAQGVVTVEEGEYGGAILNFGHNTEYRASSRKSAPKQKAARKTRVTKPRAKKVKVDTSLKSSATPKQAARNVAVKKAVVKAADAGNKFKAKPSKQHDLSAFDF